MKTKLFPILALAMLIFSSCGGESNKMETDQKNPKSVSTSVDAFDFFKEYTEDIAVFKKKYAGEQVSIENLFIEKVFDRGDERIVVLKPFNAKKPMLKSEITHVNLKKLQPDINNSNSNLYWKNLVNLKDKYYLNIGPDYIILVLEDPTSINKKDFREGYFNTDNLEVKYKEMINYGEFGIKETELTENCKVSTNPKTCRVKGLVNDKKTITLEEDEIEILD